MPFVPLIVLLALVKKLVDFVRFVKARDAWSVLTQMVAWLAGVGVVMMAAHTAWANTMIFGGVSLASMGAWSQVLAGIAVGSAGSVLKDSIAAVDNSQSAAVPPLSTPLPATAQHADGTR